MSTDSDTMRVIARNIAELRKANGMTQAGLAEQLGYSDKSISKWERAEGLPDLLCMKRIADLFGVPVDWFFAEEHQPDLQTETAAEENTIPEKKSSKYVTSRKTVALLSVAGVWMLSAVVFVILALCSAASAMPFVIALPVTALLTVIFHALWGGGRFFRQGMFAAVTLLVWSILFMTCWLCRHYNIWLLMTLGFPATVIVALACRVRKKVD